MTPAAQLPFGKLEIRQPTESLLSSDAHQPFRSPDVYPLQGIAGPSKPSKPSNVRGRKATQSPHQGSQYSDSVIAAILARIAELERDQRLTVIENEQLKQ